MLPFVKSFTRWTLFIYCAFLWLPNVQAQGVKAGVHFINGNTLSVQAHPEEKVDLSLSAVQFVLRWESSSADFNLDEVIDSAFEIEQVGAGQKDGYNYKYYSGIPVPWVGVNWEASGGPYELAQIRVSGAGTIALAPNTFLEFGAGDWYIEFEGVDFTNSEFAEAEANNGSLPVELEGFAAHVVARGVALRWRTLSEEENAGFHVEYADNPGAFESKAFITGAGTTHEAQAYSYQFEELPIGTHWFRLRQVDFDGTTSYSSTLEVDITLPGLYALDPAYPNPFVDVTTLRFAVQQDQRVTLDLYDIQGRLIRTLLEGPMEGGRMYDVDLEAKGLSSGLYIVRLRGDEFVASRKVVLAR